MASNYDTPNIMNVRDIIDAAFGDLEVNIVNFKLIKTILYLLARQLRLLERRVEVELGPLAVIHSGSTLSITEVKIHAMQKKRKKTKEQGAEGPVPKSGAGKGSRKSQSSSSDKTSTDKTSSSDKTSTDKTTSSSKDKSTSKSSSDKTRSTSTGKAKSPDKSTGKSGGRADRQAAADKPSAKEHGTDKATSREPTGDRPSSKQAGSEKSSPKRGGRKRKHRITSPSTLQLDSSPDSLDTEEERKEKVLRVIHQRADSFEEGRKSPTPMASVESMEAQHEKILVVERVPSSESRRSGKTQDRDRTPQISVVTQEQFERVAKVVRQLQSRLLPVGTPGFPEHAELMEELRRGASLTDAMAALQLSARLEVTEKALGQMISMVTELAKQTPGVELDDDTKVIFEAAKDPFKTAADIQSIYGGPGAKGADFGTTGAFGTGGGAGSGGVAEPGDTPSTKRSGGPGSTKKSAGGGGSAGSGSGRSTAHSAGSRKSTEVSSKTPAYSQTSSKSHEREITVSHTVLEKSAGSSEKPAAPPTTDAPTINEYTIKHDYITYDELQAATKELYENLLNTATSIATRTDSNAERAYKLATSLEGKIQSALNAATRMSSLEGLVSQYADQINALDTGLSSQMTNYQEQLTQMQHDLEIGLETMAEVLGNTGGDTVAVAELNSHFTNLQMDFDNMLYRQKDLKDAQDSIAYDLESLWKEIEMLRDIKSDREEVADALRDKAGIGELNGLVSLLQFDAVQGDFEKRIGAAYDKFNNQENVWQKAIDDLLKDLNEKADLVQIISLRDEVNKYLNIMKERMQVLLDIVVEPKSALISKKLFRNTACLSCGNPAHMDIEEPVLVPALPKFPTARQPGEGAEAKAEAKPKGDGDHGICFPGLPLPHPGDPRSHVCHRYCGGSHTLLNEGPSRVPPAVVINPGSRQVTTELGTDGKMYLVDEQVKKIPCIPCNIPKPLTPPPPEFNEGPVEQANGSTTPLDLNLVTTGNENVMENVSVTPPVHEFMASVD